MGTADGPRGKLFHCQSKQSGRWYWRVRLESGDWVFPDQRGGIVVDGPGDAVSPHCADCDLPFVTRAGSGELVCTACNDAIFGTDQDRASDPPPARRWNARRRWIPGKVNK
jgi:hypothetical protein